METTNHYFKDKFLPCLLVALTAGFAFCRSSTRLFYGHFPLRIAIVISLVFLTGCIIYSIRWHRRKPDQTESIQLQNLISYFVAFDLSMFGWQKLFHLQAVTPLGKLDLPFSSFPGDELVFAFFGYSFGYLAVVALLEILGALLIAFRRTRMLGLFVLFPMLLNILIMDYFYGMLYNVVLHSFIMCLAVLYLILLNYNKLIAFFLPENTRSVASPVKQLLPALVIFLPLLAMTTYHFPHRDPELIGKYTVRELKINNVPTFVKSDSDSIPTTIYMDRGRDFVVDYNSLKRRHIGTYTYDKNTGSIGVMWRYPDKTETPLKGTLVRASGNMLKLNAVLGQDTISCIMEKVD